MNIVKNQQRFVALGLLGASVALSGCITAGNFDASKSFVDTYAAWEEESEGYFVDSDNKPTGSVRYSGGFAVERDNGFYLPQTPRTAGEPLAIVEPDMDSDYIVGQLDIDVAFDDNTADLEASNLKRVTSPYSVFLDYDVYQSKSGGNASAPLGGLSEGDITVVDSIDGTLTGTGEVSADGNIAVDGVMGGELEVGSGESAEMVFGLLEVDTYLFEGPNGQFLLGEAELNVYPDKEVRMAADDPDSATGIYFGAAYAEEQ